MKAPLLLVHNIRALLSARRVRASDVAFYCGHKSAWLSKILKGERGMALEDLDRVADFFGLTVSDLFRPGISPVLERRRWDRRKQPQGDRRRAERRNRKLNITFAPTVLVEDRGAFLGADTRRGTRPKTDPDGTA